MNQPYTNRIGRRHQLLRLLWGVVWAVCARWLPRSLGCGWKRMLLRLFGARMGRGAVVYSSTRIYYPPYLTMAEYACLADGVECYNVAPITIGAYATVSQGAMLCTATHDIMSPTHELVTRPITIGAKAWIGARAYVGPGVNIGEGAVAGATASVYKDVEPWTIVGGNPAQTLKKRPQQ